jgi:hypothetical protein
MTEYVLRGRDGRFYVGIDPSGVVESTRNIDEAYRGSWGGAITEWNKISSEDAYDIYSVKIGLTVDTKMNLRGLVKQTKELMDELKEIEQLIEEVVCLN